MAEISTFIVEKFPYEILKIFDSKVPVLIVFSTFKVFVSMLPALRPFDTSKEVVDMSITDILGMYKFLVDKSIQSIVFPNIVFAQMSVASNDIPVIEVNRIFETSKLLIVAFIVCKWCTRIA